MGDRKNIPGDAFLLLRKKSGGRKGKAECLEEIKTQNAPNGRKKLPADEVGRRKEPNERSPRRGTPTIWSLAWGSLEGERVG